MRYGLLNKIVSVIVCAVGSIALLCPAQVQAQAKASSGGTAGSTKEYTLWATPLLSQSMKGFSNEVTTLYGFTYGSPGSNYYEYSGHFAQKEDRSYTSLSASIRDQSGVGKFTSLYYMGADLISFASEGESRQTALGAHFGGGMQMHIGYTFWFRPDVKFQFGPGYSVMLGFGLLYK